MKKEKPVNQPSSPTDEHGLFDLVLARIGGIVAKLETMESQQAAAQEIPADVPRFVTRR